MLKGKLLKVEKPKQLKQFVENRELLYRGSPFVSTTSGNVQSCSLIMIQIFIFPLNFLFYLFINFCFPYLLINANVVERPTRKTWLI